MISFVKEKHVWISYFLFLLSSMLVSFTILSLASLQSSLNIEAGLGKYRPVLVAGETKTHT